MDGQLYKRNLSANLARGQAFFFLRLLFTAYIPKF